MNRLHLKINYYALQTQHRLGYITMDVKTIASGVKKLHFLLEEKHSVTIM